MMSKKKHSVMEDALKAVRRANREQEIELHGHPICHVKVFRNKKIYSRKNQRVDLFLYFSKCTV